ncbi:MAG: diguanylate cyclase [Acidobacteria bacterium]|nr:diguanylate cyclase [Acidobacteriota bacterium]
MSDDIRASAGHSLHEAATDGREPTRVLVIDDDELAVSVIRKLLETDGCVMEAFTSPRQALARLAESRYDAILCDMWMGEMSGKDFYQQIQQDFPSYLQKIIFITGDFDSEATWEFIDEQQLPFVLKPFSLSELRRRLEEVVGKQKAVPEAVEPESLGWDGSERRVYRRYAIRAQVRVRQKKRAVGSADIGAVINASKDGVLFMSDRTYHLGMEVLVAFPYTGYNDLEQEGCVVRVEKHPEGGRVAVALGQAADAARAKFGQSIADSRVAQVADALPAAAQPERPEAEQEARRLAEELADLKKAHDRVIGQRDRLAAEETQIRQQLHELNTAKSTMGGIISELTTQMESLQKELAAGEQTRFLATHDSLTGLWNRSVILEILHKELVRARREGTCLGVLMADLDHFKEVNDTHGHLAGDAVLHEVAQRLQAGVREYDAVGRFGGEEFLIILPACHESPLKHAERLRKSVSSEAINTDDGAIAVTISMGVAAGGPDLFDPEAVLRAADAALYRAKRTGRNRVELANTTDAPSTPPAS